MGVVQFFEDPRDRQFWMIGSAPDVNPAILVRDGQSRCKPFSIKFVMITAVEAWWGYAFQLLAPNFFNRYLKPGLLAMWFEETKTIMSIPKPMSPVKAPKNGEQSSILALAKALGSLEEQAQTKFSNMVKVTNSVIDNPTLAKYRDEQLLELKVQADVNRTLDEAVSSVVKTLGSGMSEAARKN